MSISKVVGNLFQRAGEELTREIGLIAGDKKLSRRTRARALITLSQVDPHKLKHLVSKDVIKQARALKKLVDRFSLEKIAKGPLKDPIRCEFTSWDGKKLLREGCQYVDDDGSVDFMAIDRRIRLEHPGPEFEVFNRLYRSAAKNNMDWVYEIIFLAKEASNKSAFLASGLL